MRPSTRQGLGVTRDEIHGRTKEQFSRTPYHDLRKHKYYGIHWRFVDTVKSRPQTTLTRRKNRTPEVTLRKDSTILDPSTLWNDSDEPPPMLRHQTMNEDPPTSSNPTPECPEIIQP